MKVKFAFVAMLMAGVLLLAYAWVRERVAVLEGDAAKRLINAYGVQLPTSAEAVRVAEYQAGPQLCILAQFVVEPNQVDDAVRSMRPADVQTREYESGRIMAARSMTIPTKLTQVTPWWTFNPSTQYRVFEISSDFNATVSVDAGTGLFFIVIRD
jgi:hypothetical protein